MMLVEHFEHNYKSNNTGRLDPRIFSYYNEHKSSISEVFQSLYFHLQKCIIQQWILAWQAQRKNNVRQKISILNKNKTKKHWNQVQCIDTEDGTIIYR